MDKWLLHVGRKYNGQSDYSKGSNSLRLSWLQQSVIALSKYFVQVKFQNNASQYRSRLNNNSNRRSTSPIEFGKLTTSRIRKYLAKDCCPVAIIYNKNVISPSYPPPGNRGH